MGHGHGSPIRFGRLGLNSGRGGRPFRGFMRRLRMRWEKSLFLERIGIVSESWDFALGVEGFHFSDLYQVDRLRALHLAFWQDAQRRAPQVAEAFEQLNSQVVDGPTRSDRLIAVAKLLDDFLCRLFRLEQPIRHCAVRIAFDACFNSKPIFGAIGFCVDWIPRCRRMRPPTGRSIPKSGRLCRGFSPTSGRS